MESTRRKFPREYKIEAVRRVVEGGEPVAGAARDLGIRADTLYAWVRAFKAQPTEAFPGNGNLTSQDEEIRKLRRDLAAMREERDILKKATVFFARESR